MLDTNHLSDLARDPSQPAHDAVIRRLQDGTAAIALSIFHLVELGSPTFRSAVELRALLRDVHHVLANPFENIEDEEIACAVARAGGLSRRPPHVFARDTSEWGYHPGVPGGTALDLFEAFDRLQDDRQEMLDVANWGAQASMMKQDAALMKDPLLPLTLAVQRHLDTRRERLPSYGGGMSAGEVIARVGGKDAFPAYQVQESLVTQRMRDAGQKSTSNDVFDEYIAFYAPYAAVTAVDRRTLPRAKMARLACVPRMTRYLSEVPAILDRVIAGELVPVPSAG
ncbi:MAG: hypothetical protein AB1941_14500 [Gemmatimonadota bacterium]